jgi:hypothetical protein
VQAPLQRGDGVALEDQVPSRTGIRNNSG